MRVLVVEDIPRHANRIAEGLRDQGIAADVAYDGHEAISKVNVDPYDVVLLEGDLPGIHGDQLCEIITHSEDPPMILMLTDAGDPADRVKGLALGADDYLPKPFRFPELILRIRALARRKPGARRPTLQAGGIELDPFTGSVTRDGLTIELSRKERAVLEALLRASPDALSTERILEQAWDENVDPFTNAVKSPSPDSDASSVSLTSSTPPPVSTTGSPKRPNRTARGLQAQPRMDLEDRTYATRPDQR